MKSLTDDDMVTLWPVVPWLEPLPVRLVDGCLSGLACRLCIARNGFKAEDIAKTFQTEDQFAEHMLIVHQKIAALRRENP